MKPIAFWLLLAVALVFLHIGWTGWTKQSNLVTAHVINMDGSEDRLAEFQEHAVAAGLPVVRWPAVNGRVVGEADLVPLGLSKYIYKYSQEHNQPGLLGCYLSHRGLLQHLETLDCGEDDVHIIFEDDAYIPRDFFDQFRDTMKDVPADWDIVQLGVTFPNLRPYRGRLHRHLGNKGNVGGFAYAIRHGSLAKINKKVAIMYDPMDVMIRNQWNTWTILIAWPEVCPHNDHGRSIIVQA